jgi:hypothetical protein
MGKWSTTSATRFFETKKSPRNRYWPDCVDDTLHSYTDNGSTDSSDILFKRVQVYP